MKRYINSVGEITTFTRVATVENILVSACEELLVDIEGEIGMQLYELAHEYSEDNNHELFWELDNIKSLKSTRDDLVRFIDQGLEFKGSEWATKTLNHWGYKVVFPKWAHIDEYGEQSIEKFDSYIEAIHDASRALQANLEDLINEDIAMLYNNYYRDTTYDNQVSLNHIQDYHTRITELERQQELDHVSSHALRILQDWGYKFLEV